MTIEFGLLVLESVLLVTTVILLIYGIHEGRRRDHLLREVGRVTKVLTRQEYFFSIMEAMLDAKKEIIGCITGTPPSGDDIRMTRHIADAIEDQTGRGVRVRYLLPKFPDRLQLGVQYMKAGAEIFFSSCLLVHSIRYCVVDGKTVVLGVPESVGEREATKKGYTIPSEGLATILKNHFDDCEDKTNFKEYVQEVVKQTGATLDHLAREFRISQEDLKRLAQ
jgi:hypothetical protein